LIPSAGRFAGAANARRTARARCDAAGAVAAGCARPAVADGGAAARGDVAAPIGAVGAGVEAERLLTAWSAIRDERPAGIGPLAGPGAEAGRAERRAPSTSPADPVSGRRTRAATDRAISAADRHGDEAAAERSATGAAGIGASVLRSGPIPRTAWREPADGRGSPDARTGPEAPASRAAVASAAADPIRRRTAGGWPTGAWPIRVWPARVGSIRGSSDRR
jgi:hypothetical protein